MSRAGDLLNKHADLTGTVSEGVNRDAVKTRLDGLRRKKQDKDFYPGVEDAIKGAEYFELVKAKTRDIGSGNVGFWVIATDADGNEKTVDQTQIYASGKGATVAAREDGAEIIAALELFQKELNEALDEALTDDNSMISIALLLLHMALKAGGHKKVAAALNRKHKDQIKEPAELADLVTFFNDVNYYNYGEMARGIMNGAEEWKIQALWAIQLLADKRGGGEFAATALTTALVGDERAQKFQKGSPSKVDVSSELAKIIADMPDDFQQELKDDYNFQL